MAACIIFNVFLIANLHFHPPLQVNGQKHVPGCTSLVKKLSQHLKQVHHLSGKYNVSYINITLSLTLMVTFFPGEKLETFNTLAKAVVPTTTIKPEQVPTTSNEYIVINQELIDNLR